LSFKVKKVLTCYPEVKYWPLTDETEFIVVACDGVWDVISNFKVADYVRRSLISGAEPTEIAKSLVDHCLGMGSTDNISIIIVSFLTAKKIELIKNSDIKGDESEMSGEVKLFSDSISKLNLPEKAEDVESKRKFSKIDMRNKIILSNRELIRPSSANHAYQRSPRSPRTSPRGANSDSAISPPRSPRVSPRAILMDDHVRETSITVDVSVVISSDMTDPQGSTSGNTLHPPTYPLRISNPDLLKAGRADERRREKLKQSTLLQKKIESTQRNYSTCKF